MKLQPDSALSKRQLRRRRKLGISVPGVYTTNEETLQADTLSKLDKEPTVIKNVEIKSPSLAADLKARLERRKYRKEQKNA